MQLRKSLCFALFLALMSAVPATAKAEPKPWPFSWWPSHWENLTFKPYLEHPTQPQNSQWDEKTWEPADWAAQRKGGSDQVIQGFYNSGILNDQYVENDVPVLEVGPGFYRLSGYDKRRVMRVVDDYYKITSNHGNAIFTVADWRSHEPIGLYTANGLQLQ